MASTVATKKVKAAPAPAAAAAANQVSNSEFEGQTYSFADALATSVPEIAALIKKASAGGWDSTRFADAMQATNWWRTNSETARSVIATKANDPTTYNNNHAQALAHVESMAAQLGVHMSAAQIQSQVTASMMQGLSDEALQTNIAGMYQSGGGSSGGGKATDLNQQLTQLAAQYGVPVTQAWLDGQTKQALLTGDTSMGAATKSLIATATSTYPALKDQLSAGQTVQQIADPYMAAMSQTLEIPQTSIKLTDPTIQKALTNTAAVPGASPAAAPGQSVMPLWQYTQQLKQDPRWGQTDNAKQTAYSTMAALGKSFGFEAQ